MKKLFAAAILSATLFSCADKQQQEKDLLNEVIAIHDRVMEKDELVMINKMQLDTLIKDSVSADVTTKAISLRGNLDTVDSRMEKWMHNFDAENKGKSHDEIITYLTDQKKQISALDSNLNIAVKTADTFIKQNKKK
ncbi:hypothetical protein D0C36_02880 [Mucilaginibacter conchicola]|uniref:Viral A-type inclusion protein n=1 Tax=Mucilaginibacter conchicola TaxID=2303333 RepID=A0A372NWL9_9SPHI|nr:hypothetical protein [Mucilaginibacter conchicola]RFZ94508.1 hypothetical protein D0C36_02880 [Mucilaginibacter conchicola]